MPPKRKAKKAPIKAKATEALPELANGQPVLYIEHCRSCMSFKRRALELHTAILKLLQENDPSYTLQLQLNPDGTQRSGAFEIAFAGTPTDAEQRSQIWSGLKRTPRAKKFPPPEDVVKSILAIHPVAEDTKPPNDEDKKGVRKSDTEEKPKRKRTASPPPKNSTSKESPPSAKKIKDDKGEVSPKTEPDVEEKSSRKREAAAPPKKAAAAKVAKKRK